jgi:hypothetical protein
MNGVGGVIVVRRAAPLEVRQDLGDPGGRLLRKPGYQGQMHGRGRARWWQDMLLSPKRRHAERHEANRSQRAEP